MSDGPRRRLAAVMFADMVGYTALMQEDESAAISRRDRFRSALDEAVKQCHGETLQHYGDGALSVFSSAVEAVEAAVAMQSELRKEPQVPARIGVHSGDIVQDGGEIFGDGVNVASRIESLGAPGGVLVSGKVYDEIKNHASFSVEPMGEVSLKNVQRPVKVFAISNEGLHVPTPQSVQAHAWQGDGPAGRAVVEAAPSSAPASPGTGERLLQAIRERALVQWVLLYVVGAWAVLQAGAHAAAALAWPPVVHRSLLVAAAVGLPITLVVTWYHGQKGRQRVTPREVTAIAAILAIGAGLLTVFGPETETGRRGPPTMGAVGSASTTPAVAALPFANLSGTPEAEPFARGIHDDILTQLTKIAGLKVISRTSVLGYRDTDKNVRQIAEELGVDAVLEGGVQRVNDRIRINAQLIDADTDLHLWAETFDTVYTVESVFAIQSAIATAIAEALEAVLTQEERAGIDDVPTDDLEAYELYLSGIENMARPGWNIGSLADAQEDFERATDLDPGFALAYANLAAVHYVFFRVAYDTSPGRLEAIRETAERSLEIDPDLPQGHQALSHYLYLTGQVDRALTELAIAGRGLPNDPWVPVTRGTIRQRQGAWDQALVDFERAVELDPRNPELIFLLGDTYSKLRRWDEAERQFDRALAIAPGLPEARLMKAMIAIDRDGSPDLLLLLFEGARPEQDPLGQAAFFLWWGYFLARDFEDADAVLSTVAEELDGWQVQYPAAMLRGITLTVAGRPEAARPLVEAELPGLEQLARERPDDARAHSGLGLAYAVLGMDDAAVREGMRATELVPISQDAYFGPGYLSDLARIYTMVGELDLAIDQLETLLTIPGELSAAELGLDPIWDPLRAVPRFQALVGG